MTQQSLVLRYLLDTNMISHMMANPDGIVAKRAQLCMASPALPQLCTSIVVHCELSFGLQKRPSNRLQAALAFQLASVVVLPLDQTVVTHYASLRAQLESVGQPIGPNDALIAAHALALEATLVSADAEFARVPGLKLENWLANETT
ncbi:MAG: PIN domain-containing protein [Burkholderiaceae bacterium]